MRVISEDKPNVWDEKVVVEMSVKELALIHVTMSKTTSEDDREAIDRTYGQGTYITLKGFGDYGQDLYTDIDDLLRKKGVLK